MLEPQDMSVGAAHDAHPRGGGRSASGARRPARVDDIHRRTGGPAGAVQEVSADALGAGAGCEERDMGATARDIRDVYFQLGGGRPGDSVWVGVFRRVSVAAHA